MTPPPAIHMREAVVVVVAAVHLPLVRARGGELDGGRAAELAPPDHQGVVQHPALLEVHEERGDRPVALVRQRAMAGRQIVVVVPGLAVAVPELDEADPALQQPPGRQELAGVHAGPVHRPDRFRLLGDVERLGRFRLHAISQLERLDPRLELGLVRAAVQVSPVQLGQQVELGALGLGADRAVRMCAISFSISVCLLSM